MIESLSGVVANVVDWDIVVSEFEPPVMHFRFAFLVATSTSFNYLMSKSIPVQE